MAEFEPQIVGFFCNWCSYTGADPSGTPQLEWVSESETPKAADIIQSFTHSIK